MTTQEGLIGIRERFIMKVEGSYGDAPSLATAFVPGVDIIVTPDFTQGFQEVLSAGTDNRTAEKRVAGPLNLRYDLAFYPVNWRFLKFMFDIDSETGGPTYTHTLSVGDTQMSFTSEWAMRHSTDPVIFKIVGNVMNRLAITFEKPTGEGNEGFVTCKSAILAQDYTTPALQAGSFTATGDPFQFRHFKVVMASGEIIEVNNGELVFDQGILPNDSRYANTGLDRTIGTPINTVFRISGRLNLNLVDATTRDLWELAAVLSGTNTLELTQTAGNKITFTLTGVYIEPVPIESTNIEGINRGDFVFTATGVTIVAIDAIQNW